MNKSLKRKSIDDKIDETDEIDKKYKYLKLNEDDLSESFKSLKIKPKRRLPMSFFIDYSDPTESTEKTESSETSEDFKEYENNTPKKSLIKSSKDDLKLMKSNFTYQTDSDSDDSILNNLMETSDFEDGDISEYDNDSDSEELDELENQIIENEDEIKNENSELENEDDEIELDDDLPTDFKSEEFVYDSEEDDNYNEDYLIYKIKKVKL